MIIDRTPGPHRWDALATYNAEVSRGIVHRPEVDALMAEEQALFNADREERLRAEGWTRMPGTDNGWWFVPVVGPRVRWWRRVARKARRRG